MAAIRKLASIFKSIVTWCSELSSILVIVMMAIITIDVGGRFIFNSPLPAGNEIAGVLMMAIVFLAFPYAESRGKHVKIEFADRFLSPRQISALDTIACLVGVLIFSLITWQGWQQALHSLQVDERMIATIRFPLYPAKFLLVFGATLLTIQFLIGLITNLRKTTVKRGIANG